jgi:hypothetical protein
MGVCTHLIPGVDAVVLVLGELYMAEQPLGERLQQHCKRKTIPKVLYLCGVDINGDEDAVCEPPACMPCSSMTPEGRAR